MAVCHPVDGCAIRVSPDEVAAGEDSFGLHGVNPRLACPVDGSMVAELQRVRVEKTILGVLEILDYLLVDMLFCVAHQDHLVAVLILEHETQTTWVRKISSS